MSDIRTTCRRFAQEALIQAAQKHNLPTEGITLESIILETPPKPELGDIGIPAFPFAKIFRLSPLLIAQEVAHILQENSAFVSFGSAKTEGPYINISFNKTNTVQRVLKTIETQAAQYGESIIDGDGNTKRILHKQQIMLEFSSPNTNKPLHLGHLRNDALGESMSRILKTAGADVFKVSIINNRGVHICKSMLAYQKCANGATPESSNIKSDKFVGDYYVKYHELSKNDPSLEQEAQNLLLEWENGNKEVHDLWQKMNQWAVQGMMQTYKRTDISFDRFYYESDTYLKGKEQILEGLKCGLFYRDEDGSVWVDLAEIGLDKKVLLRKDGTALYITQDIGTALYRHSDWPFNRLIYVVGSEQQYHFKVLFYVLKKLGYDWAQHLYHLSYGMVNLPEGKMKSREGTVVDADDLIDQLRDGALEEITAKGREEAVGDPVLVAEKVALGALHYYLLQATPSKDMLFNPKESLAFNGNTGPYLQYMGARICSILRKAESEGIIYDAQQYNASLLTHEAEWELAKLLGEYPTIVAKAALELGPHYIASLLYDTAKAFSRFYHDCPILSPENQALKMSRLALVHATKTVLENGMKLILVPFLETM